MQFRPLWLVQKKFAYWIITSKNTQKFFLTFGLKKKNFTDWKQLKSFRTENSLFRIENWFGLKTVQKLSDWKQSVSDWKLLSDWKQLQRYTKNSCFYFCSLKNTQRVPEKIDARFARGFRPEKHPKGFGLKTAQYLSDWKQSPGFATSFTSIGLDISKPTRYAI